jgi:hypothetical protein
LSRIFDRVMDAIDLETFLVCKDEEEGKKISMQIMNELGFNDISIVFIQHQGTGARVRIRGYIYKPGDHYGWLFEEKRIGG